MFITIYRTMILYVTVIIAVRLMGKRQIGEMQPGELVVTLLISDIASMPLQDTNQPIILGLSAIFTLVCLEIITSLLSLKSVIVRKLLSGGSAILIKDGIIDQKELGRVRMTVLDLVEMLRSQQVFEVSDVSFAVLETGGSLSVLLKGEKSPPTAEQFGINFDQSELPLPVISDGKLLKDAFSAIGTNKQEIEKILKKAKIKQKEVFLMTLDSSGKNEIVRKENKA